jgi:protein-S-isoprenylcysteine O-methyltransferase Ste14
MDWTHTGARLLCYATWLAFGVCMVLYFRGARRRTAAKMGLTALAAACTGGQIAVLALADAPDLWLSWGGIVGFVAANVLYWAALATHGSDRPAFAFLPMAPQRLKTTGPYRLVRHPIYSAYLLAWVSGALVAGQWWLLACPLLMAAVYYRAARQEEEILLTGPLAAQYRVYQMRTGMFVPRRAA